MSSKTTEVEVGRVEVGYAALTPPDNVDTSDPTVVSGVAIGEGDVTIGGSGKQTYWPEETLREAAEGLQGQPLATDVDHTADDPSQQTPIDAVVGEVTWSGYAPGVGVVYEAEVDDESLAEKIANGRLEVSPLVARDLEPREEGDAEYEATAIHRWRDLALVVNGAAPSNEVAVGESPMQAEALHGTIAALQADVDLTPPEAAQNHAQDVLDWRDDPDKEVSGMTDTGWSRAEQLASGEELSPDDVQEIAAWFARHGSGEYDLNEEGMDPWRDNGRVAIKGWGGPAMRDWIDGKRSRLVETGDLEAMSAEALKEVAGVEFDSTGTGSLDESEIPNDDYRSHYLYPNATKTESAYPVVDGDGVLRKGNVDSAWSLGARGHADEGTHDQRLLRLADEFDTPPEWANMDDAESMADFADLSDDDLVEWDSSGGTAQGRIVDLRDEGEPDYDDEIDGDVTVSPPAALIEIVGMDDGEVVGQDTMVAHKPDTLTVIDESDIEAMSEHEDSMQDVPDEYIFSNPGEAVSKAQEMGLEGSGDEIIHTHGEGDETVFMPAPSHGELMDMIESDGESGDEAMWSDDPAWASSAAAETTTNSESTMNDTEKAILSAAESVEEPIEALEAHAAAEEPTVVESETYESMRATLADALKDKTGLKDKTVEAMSFGALVGEFEDDDGNLKAEALTQTPETAQPDADGGAEALSEDADMEKAEALYADYNRLASAPESLENDITEALGVEDFAKAEEVLN